MGVGDEEGISERTGPAGLYDRTIGHAVLRRGQFSARFLELEEDEVPETHARACSNDGREARILDNFAFYDESG